MIRDPDRNILEKRVVRAPELSYEMDILYVITKAFSDHLKHLRSFLKTFEVALEKLETLEHSPYFQIFLWHSRTF